MVISNNWIKWEPIQGLSKKYFLGEFLDSTKEFKLQLIDAADLAGKALLVSQFSWYSYRYTDLRLRQKTLHWLRELHGNEFTEWTFFKVENSAYVAELVVGGCEVNAMEDFTHFVFLTQDAILEIVTRSKWKDPLVTYI